MIQYSSIILILLLIILIIIVTRQITINKVDLSKYFDSGNNLNYSLRNFRQEGFENSVSTEENYFGDKLDVRKTNSYKLIFKNAKYSIWEPKMIDNYIPVGHIVTKKNKPPKTFSILVNSEKTMSIKPDKFNIVAISNNNFGVWQPVSDNPDYVSLGNIFSKEYPSKYSVRLVNKKYLVKSDLSKMIIKDKVGDKDKGYEIWGIKDSDLFTVNNKNNVNEFNSLKNIYNLNYNLIDVSKKMYIKYTMSYKKIMSFKDNKMDKEFSIWRPVPPNNFCSLGDVILNSITDPNNILQTVVVHKSFCKFPTSYGLKPVVKIQKKSKEYSLWKPEAPENYYFLGHVVTNGVEEPSSENLVACIPVDYLDKTSNKTHNLIWNNVNEENPKSLWMSYLNLVSGNNKYNSPDTNSIVINRDLTASDIDLLDNSKSIVLSFKKNNKNMKPLDIIYTRNMIKHNFSRKFDIDENRIKIDNFDIKNKKLTMTILPRKIDTNSILVNDTIEQIQKTLNLGDIKIYTEDKSDYIILIDDGGIVKDNLNEIDIDNSDYKLSFD
jgi:hypothetical protein